MKTNITKHISEVTWLESNQGITIIIKTGRDFNIYNYKSSPYTMKLANNLAAGGEVILDGVTHRLEDEDTIEHFQLEQLEYLTTKYNRITGDGARLARKFFNNRNEADAFFKSPSWAQAKARHFKLNVLEVLVPTLMTAQEQVLLEQAYKDYKKYESRLNVIGLRDLKIRREDILKDLPNQGVTTAIAPTLEAQQKIGEAGPYVTFNGDYSSSQLAVLESRMVNAWLYNQEEFRVPSKEEQATELEELREWFQELKEVLRRFSEEQVREFFAKDPAVVTKYERLETLEIAVGTYLEKDPVITLAGTVSKRMDHSSRTFKANRLAQLHAMERFNDPRLYVELLELQAELSK